MKLNSMKPAKINAISGRASKSLDNAAISMPAAAADKSDHLQPDAADPVRQEHREDDADDQQHRDQRRAFGGDDIVQDQVGDAADMVDLAAEGRGEDGRREDADAVAADDPAGTTASRPDSGRAVALLRNSARVSGRFGGPHGRWRQLACRATARFCRDKAARGTSRRFAAASARSWAPRICSQLGAFGDGKAADRDGHGGKNGGGRTSIARRRGSGSWTRRESPPPCR